MLELIIMSALGDNSPGIRHVIPSEAPSENGGSEEGGLHSGQAQGQFVNAPGPSNHGIIGSQRGSGHGGVVVEQLRGGSVGQPFGGRDNERQALGGRSDSERQPLARDEEFEASGQGGDAGQSYLVARVDNSRQQFSGVGGGQYFRPGDGGYCGPGDGQHPLRAGGGSGRAGGGSSEPLRARGGSGEPLRAGARGGGPLQGGGSGGEPFRAGGGGSGRAGGGSSESPRAGGGNGEPLRAVGGSGEPLRARGGSDQSPRQPRLAAGNSQRARAGGGSNGGRYPSGGGGNGQRRSGSGGRGVARRGRSPTPIGEVGEESEGEEDDDVNLVVAMGMVDRGDDTVECFSVRRRTRNALCTMKCQRSTRCKSMLLVAAVFAVLITPLVTGITLIYIGEQTKDVYMYTSANESYKIYDSTAVTLMRRVCMQVEDFKTEVARGEYITWVLYTSYCDTSKPADNSQFRTYNITNEIMTSKGYYFYFSDSSSIHYHPNQTGSEAKSQFTTSTSKARNLQDSCDRPLPPAGNDFGNTGKYGYYYVCVLPDDGKPLNYTLSVNEYYFNISGHRNYCRDNVTENGQNMRCCHLSQDQAYSLHHHCVYISAANETTTPLSEPVKLHVSVSYDDAMKTVLIMLLLIMVSGAVVLLTLMYVCEVRRERRGRQRRRYM